MAGQCAAAEERGRLDADHGAGRGRRSGPRRHAADRDQRSIAPAVSRWEKGGEIMGLPLRDAREMFEREYLLAQITRFGGNISRTAEFRRHGALGACTAS